MIKYELQAQDKDYPFQIMDKRMSQIVNQKIMEK